MFVGGGNISIIMTSKLTSYKTSKHLSPRLDGADDGDYLSGKIIVISTLVLR